MISHNEKLQAEVLSQILLIQNVVGTLPDGEAMLSFAAKGLEELPGVTEATFHPGAAAEPPSERESDFSVHLGSTTYATMRLTLGNPDAFANYEPYVHNVCFMIAGRLEERRQQEEAEQQQRLLEDEVTRRTAEAELQRQRAQEYLEATEAIIVELDLEGRIERINKRGALLLKRPPHKLIGCDWFDLTAPQEERAARKRQFKEQLAAEQTMSAYQDGTILSGDQELRSMQWHNRLRSNAEGVVVGTLHSGIDVTERRQAEEEKEVLLKEVYHRTKNNMHVIVSLLSLQAARSRSAEVREAMMDAENRIMAMALVHNMLYSSDKLSKLKLREYVEELADGVLSGYDTVGVKTRLEISGDSPKVSLATAIACGLALNELVTNSAKHAFSETTENPEIAIDIVAEGDEVAIYYRDNGPGIPEDAQESNDGSLGLQIIRSQIEDQLAGSFAIHPGARGFKAEIHFEKSDDDE